MGRLITTGLAIAAIALAAFGDFRQDPGFKPGYSWDNCPVVDEGGTGSAGQEQTWAGWCFKDGEPRGGDPL